MEQEKNNKGVIALLVIIIVILLVLVILFATGTINLSNKENNNNNENANTQEEANVSSLSTVCTAEVYDKLEILSMENKTEKIRAMGGSTTSYNVTTTVTKEHNYTSTPGDEELYAVDYRGNLFVLYRNKLYYTAQKDIISKYCESKEILLDSVFHSIETKCNYSKFNDNNIKEFNEISIDVSLKAIGSFGNGGSGSQRPYAITTDGKVISIDLDSSRNNNACGIMYDNSEYPIDRIFNMFFYDGKEYTILLKDGTLITRDVDREHPIVSNN